MRARVLAMGCLFMAVIAACSGSAAADLSPYSLMPSMAGFGFPMLESQGYLSDMMSPGAMFGLTSGFLPDDSGMAALNGLAPALAGSLSAFPALSGFGSFASPVNYASQYPMMSSFGLSGLQIPSAAFSQPSITNPFSSPSSANNYTEASNGKTITIKKGDVIHVQLPARIDQGYMWNMSATGGLNITNMRMYPPGEVNPITSSGQVVIETIQEWDITALTPGTQEITAVYAPAGTSAPVVDTYRLTVIVQ